MLPILTESGIKKIEIFLQKLKVQAGTIYPEKATSKFSRAMLQAAIGTIELLLANNDGNKLTTPQNLAILKALFQPIRINPNPNPDDPNEVQASANVFVFNQQSRDFAQLLVEFIEHFDVSNDLRNRAHAFLVLAANFSPASALPAIQLNLQQAIAWFDKVNADHIDNLKLCDLIASINKHYATFEKRAANFAAENPDQFYQDYKNFCANTVEQFRKFNYVHVFNHADHVIPFNNFQQIGCINSRGYWIAKWFNHELNLNLTLAHQKRPLLTCAYDAYQSNLATNEHLSYQHQFEKLLTKLKEDCKNYIKGGSSKISLFNTAKKLVSQNAEKTACCKELLDEIKLVEARYMQEQDPHQYAFEIYRLLWEVSCVHVGICLKNQLELGELSDKLTFNMNEFSELAFNHLNEKNDPKIRRHLMLYKDAIAELQMPILSSGPKP